jgi:nicotinate-nucleotide adenylyltransferase
VRIGLYGGTFDPIHLGHLRAAENAREAVGLDLVAFLPAAVPPHRGGAPLSPAADRLAMVRLATASHPRFEAWDAELRRPGPSYTVETVSSLLRERPSDTFVLVVGADTWPEIATWHDPQKLLALVEVAVVDRPGYTAEEPVAPFPGARGVRRAEGPSLPVSATAVRERARQGLSVRYLVPDAVAEYIVSRRLYQ